MKRYKIHSGEKFICNATVAGNFFRRLKGLMFKKEIARKEGLLIKFSSFSSSHSVHSLFMRFPIDLVFIDSDLRVVDIKTLHPWKYYKPKKSCEWVLELNAGVVEEKGIKIMDTLEFREI